MSTTLQPETEKAELPNRRLYLAIAILACVLGYLLGFIVSTKTGVEPGFFEQAESGGYGVVAEKPINENVDADIQRHYEQLSEE